MILDGFYPEDIRVTKEAVSLIEGGFEVHLLCKKRKADQISFELVNGIKVHRIEMGRHLYVTTFWQTVNAAFWVQPIFYRALPSFIEDNKIDVLHVHDLPLANTTIKIAKRYNLKVVLDLHENYPAGLQTWSSKKTNPIVKLKNKLFFNYSKWSNYESRMCSEASAIIAVVDEMKERLTKVYQLPSSKVVTITNTEPTSFIEGKVIYEDVKKKFEDRYVIGYVGGFGPHRGLETAIEALPILKEKIPNILLMLVGRGSILSNLKALVKELAMENHVEFIGFQPFEKVFSFMAVADINIIPHYKNEHTDNTIPHKLFQNLMIGKPVLVSSADTLKRVIEEIDGGYVFKAGDVADFVDKVLEIKKSTKIVQQRIKNARHHTLNGQLNWETTGKRLISFYQGIEN